MPLARPAPDARVATLWVVLTALFHGEPATRAGNPAFPRNLKPVPGCDTAACVFERPIRSVIEEDWLELAPQLRAIASGNNWIDSAEFQHNVEIFLALARGHIELEEKMIYPQARALKARSASRTAREPL